MQITCLLENTPGATGCGFEHGLSFHVATGKQNLLVDTGQSNLTLQNADRLGIDLSAVDTVVLSHAHYDHTGGVLGLLERNHHATLYLRQEARGDFFGEGPTGKRYNGADKRIFESPQVHWVHGDETVNEELSLFGGVTERVLWPKGNLRLYRRVGEEYLPDSFDHEQYACLRADGLYVLLGGCAHAGIVNILRRFRQIYHRDPNVVLSGFHMMKATPYDEEDRAQAEAIADELLSYDTRFYTGHCTGQEGFDLLKERMGDRLKYIHSGDRVELG